jgi:hypothetical protein
MVNLTILHIRAELGEGEEEQQEEDGWLLINSCIDVDRYNLLSCLEEEETLFTCPLGKI